MQSRTSCLWPAADYDLTGQILWPAAHLLAEYLAANMHSLAIFNAACELGAGLGLVGLLAAQVKYSVLSVSSCIAMTGCRLCIQLRVSPKEEAPGW